jgi:hypothetical protein
MFKSKIVFGNNYLKKYFLIFFPKRLIIDFSGNLKDESSVNLNEIIKENREDFVSVIKDYLELLNIENAGLEWFAYTCSAKNPLSSPVIERILKVMACIYLIKKNPHDKFVILNATAAQECSINNALKKTNRGSLILYIERFLKILNAWRQGNFYLQNIKEIFLSSAHCIDRNLDIGIITFVDGTNRAIKDPYFGSLLNDIIKFNPDVSVAYLPYIYTPFKTRIEELGVTETNPWSPLFSYLTFSDLEWISKKRLSILFRSRVNFDVPVDAEFSPKFIIEEANLEDMAFQYIINLVFYRIGCRIRETQSVKRLIYPFENKSLEKCMLLGLEGLIETVGYQHSSITPRHFSFLMGKKEIGFTPLPDKIVTSGLVTYNWLRSIGNFPLDKLFIGCSLRYKHDFFEGYKSFSGKSAKLFLALSSSYSELYDGLNFLKAIYFLNPSFILRVRTHPNFPLGNLPKDLLDWVEINVEVNQESSLKENFEWSDVTLYISSTVALESLMFGVPVLHLDIDKLDSDPLLINVPNKWAASNPEDCITAVNEIASLSYDEKISMGKAAIGYINDYFIPQNENSYKLFLN